MSPSEVPIQNVVVNDYNNKDLLVDVMTLLSRRVHFPCISLSQKVLMTMYYSVESFAIALLFLKVKSISPGSQGSL